LFIHLYRQIRTAHRTEGTACTSVLGQENSRVEALFVEVLSDCYKSLRACGDTEATPLAPFTEDDDLACSMFFTVHCSQFTVFRSLPLPFLLHISWKYSVTVLPPSILAISSILSFPLSAFTLATVLPCSIFFSTRKCLSARLAIWGRWVIHRTCLSLIKI